MSPTAIAASEEVEPLRAAREECLPSQKVWYRAEEERNYYALHYVCYGKGKLIYNDKTYMLKEGDMFLVSPGSEVTYMSVEKWQYYWVDVRGSRVYDYLRKVGFGDYMILKGVKGTDLAEIFQSITDALSSGDELTAKGWFFILLGKIQNSEIRRSEGRRMAERHVEAVKQYLQFHYYYPDVTLTSLAENLAVSKNYLCKIFREKTGKTPIGYLIEIRMNDAGRRLVESGDSIAQIASTVGYKDALYFSKEFKKHFGITPAKYRKLYSQKN